MSKRLSFLEKMTSEGSTDPFAWYGLALEYRNVDRHDEALRTFEALRKRNPEYVPMYLMCGQMLEKLEKKDQAREWYQAGVAAARAKGDSHAQTELEAALTALA